MFFRTSHGYSYFNILPSLGPGTNLAAKTLAERLLLCRGAQYRPLLLHLSLFSQLAPQILDTRRNGLSDF